MVVEKMGGIEKGLEANAEDQIVLEDHEHADTKQLVKEEEEDLGPPHILVYGIPFDAYDGVTRLLPFTNQQSTTRIFDDKKIKAYDKLHRQRVEEQKKFLCEGDSLYEFATSVKSSTELFIPVEVDSSIVQAAIAFIAPCIENELEKLELESHLFQMREIYSIASLSLPSEIEEIRDLMDTSALQELEAVNTLEQAIELVCKYGAFFLERITLGGAIVTTAKMEKRQWTAPEMMTSRLGQVSFDNSLEPMTENSRALFKVKDETCEWGCKYVTAHVTRQAYGGRGGGGGEEEEEDAGEEENEKNCSLAPFTWQQQHEWKKRLASCTDPKIVSWTMKSIACLALSGISQRFLQEAISQLLNHQMQSLRHRDEVLHEASARAAARRRVANHDKIRSVIDRLQLFIEWCQEQADQALAWQSTWIAELERERNEKWMNEALVCKSMILQLIKATEEDEVEEFRTRIFKQIAQEFFLIDQWKTTSNKPEVKEEKAIEIHQAAVKVLLRIATHTRYFEWTLPT